MDSIASLYNRFENLPMSIERWVLDNSAVLKFRHIDNSMVVHFERLVENPEKNYRSIVDFLNVSWHKDVLNIGQSIYENQLAEDNMIKRYEQVKQDFYVPQSIWRNIFSDVQIKKIKVETEILAAKLGYREDKMI